MAGTAIKEAPTENATGFENAKFNLRAIPLNKIRFGKYSLRDADRNSEDFQRLRDSIAASNGPYMPILVREIDDPENKGQTAFGLVDGLQRTTACIDLGFKEIPARVIDMDDAEVAAAQIIANRSRIETKPVEYTKQLHRMLNADPTLTLEELADQLHCSVKWLQDRLSLQNLHPSIGPFVDEGKITLAHAFAMVKLKPMDEQLAFVEQAQTQGIQEFSGHVTNRVKAIREAARAGRDPNSSNEFKPVPHMRPVKEIKAQFEAPTLAKEVCKEIGAKSAEDGFRAALTWVLSMNPTKVEELRQADADRKVAEKEKKEKEKKEKLAKRAVEARDAAQKAGVTVPADGEGGGGDEDEEEDDDNE
jgi:ParB family chromosome partitioning protein